MLFGGDQLAASHYQCVQSACCHDDLPEEWFDGFMPVTDVDRLDRLTGR